MVVVELGETEGGADAAAAVTRGYNTRSLDDGGTQGAFAHSGNAEGSTAGGSAARRGRLLA